MIDMTEIDFGKKDLSNKLEYNNDSRSFYLVLKNLSSYKITRFHKVFEGIKYYTKEILDLNNKSI